MRLKFDLAKLAQRRRGGGQKPGVGGSAADADKLTGMMGEGHSATTAQADPLKLWKILAGILAVANIAAFFLLVKPIGGSAADLEARLADLQMQLKRQQLSLRSMKELVSKVDGARAQHERFMETYFLDRRTMSSTILGEIKESAGKAGLVPKEHSFGFEPIEGTENLGMMTITANYEGEYKQLVEFVHLIDRSKRFLIIDNIQAAPQQQTERLVTRFKINAFVREMPRGVTSSSSPPATGTAPVEPLAVAPAPSPATPPRPPATTTTALPVAAKPSPVGERK